MGAMRAARARRLPPRWMSSGLTLLEVLVVFVLATLVGTLMIQGAGFFLGQYDIVKRIGRDASSEALQQRWFASTVHGMVPYLSPERNFAGDAGFFQGVTLQPLRARSGIPVATRWSIVESADSVAVVYSEQSSPCPPGTGDPNRTPGAAEWDTHADWDTHPSDVLQGLGGMACVAGASPLGNVHWAVLESYEPLAFEYAGLDGAWRQSWPIADTREWIPRKVRLVTSAGQTVWIATFGLYQEPVGNPRDFG